MATTLAASLQTAAINFETLHQRYNPMLALVKELIGVIPNCDPILEIWPPGFRTYNLMVPNLLNLPNTLFGNKALKTSMGLAMYASSMAASCAYCTAHTCSFALRRGVGTDAIKGIRTPKQHAVVALAEGLSRLPADLSMAEVHEAREYFSSSEIEQLVLSVSMMGFLNKFMNAIGVELEQEAINDTATILSQTGWHPGIHITGEYRVTKTATIRQDNLLTYLRVVRQAPGAVVLEKKWTNGVPTNYTAAVEYLQKHTGYSFPILKPLSQGRVIRALTTILRDNLSKELTTVGLKIKMLAGYAFALLVKNDVLKKEITNLSVHLAPELNEERFIRLNQTAWMEVPADGMSCRETMTLLQRQLALTEQEAAVMLLAIAASPSPAQVNDTVIEMTSRHLKPSGIVEIIVWLSLLQLLHRLSSYYTTVGAY